jgi:hypothetical protein
LINNEWASLFPNACIEHCNFNHSDHRPLLLNIDFYVIQSSTQGGPKRFEARWLREEQFPDLVQDTWERMKNDPAVPGVFDKLARMHSVFHDWDQRVLKKPKKRLRKAQCELEEVISGPMTDVNEEKRK